MVKTGKKHEFSLELREMILTFRRTKQRSKKGSFIPIGQCDSFSKTP